MNYSKGALHYVLVLLIIFVASSMNIISGWNGNQLKSTFVDPAKKIISTVGGIFNPKPTPISKQSNQFIPQIDYSATASSETKTSLVITITPTRRVYYPTSTYTPPRTSPIPSIAYPTIAPGEPGSKEWNEEFWKKWNEMSQQNNDLQKSVEEAQKQFCQENPSLCN